MIYLNKFDTHASYEAELNVGGGLDISSPNVSYCEDVKDIHYTPCKFVRFYVGEITGTTPQTVKIYTDSSTFNEVQVSEDNKWYTYALPKDKKLYAIKSGVFDKYAGWTNGIVKKVAIKANINYTYNIFDEHFENMGIIPTSTEEASFNGSDISNLNSTNFMFYYCSGLTSLDLSGWNTSNVTNMSYMFEGCTGLTSLDLSGWNTSNVTSMDGMFEGCSNSLTIIMKGCSEATIGNIRTQLEADGITGVTINP